MEGRSAGIRRAAEHIGNLRRSVLPAMSSSTRPIWWRFFKSVSCLLKHQGILSLAVPDKRFCFDYFLPVSLTGDVLEAHAERRTRHSKKALYNSIAYKRSRRRRRFMDARHCSSAPRSFPDRDVHTAKYVYDEHRESADAPYVDAHAW